MTDISLGLGRRALSVLVGTMLVACGACSGTTEPLEVVDISGAWAGRVHWAHTIEITLAQSATGVVTGTGIKRIITPDRSTPGALDTMASSLRIEGSIGSARAELEIIDVAASAFNSFKTVAYRFNGTTGSKTMTGTLSIVQGSELNFGPPHTPIPAEKISFTWVRAP